MKEEESSGSSSASIESVDGDSKELHLQMASAFYFNVFKKALKQ